MTWSGSSFGGRYGLEQVFEDFVQGAVQDLHPPGEGEGGQAVQGDPVSTRGFAGLGLQLLVGESRGGQALADEDRNDVPIPVKLRGICLFGYTGSAPVVNGTAGVLASATDGKVKAPASGNGVGINVRVDTAISVVHVLL